VKPRLWSAALTALVLLAAACGTSSTTAPRTGSEDASPRRSAPQRTLVIGIRGELPSVAAKPLVPVTGALAPPTTLFNATLDFADERGNGQPYLAEALPDVGKGTWKVFPDGRMETNYTLRPNLTWQDGTPLSAEDFVFAWRVYSTPELGVSTSPPIVQMEDVSATDDRTLVIRWKQTYGDAGVMKEDFQALPRHILGDQFANLDPSTFINLTFWTQEYVGLGPYRITSWEPGAYVDAVAFDGYVFGRPKIDRIRVQPFGDPNAALANLLSEQIHFVGDFVFSETDGETLEERWHATNNGGKVLYAPVELRLGVLQLRPEYADPQALLDARVRRALAMSIDSPTAVEVLSLNKGLLTYTLSSPNVDYYSEIQKGVNLHAYDPRGASALLEEAGFVKGSNGFYSDRSGKTLNLPVWSSSGAKNEREVAVYVDSVRKVGWDASINVFSAAQLADAQARALIPGLAVRGLGQKRLEAFTTEQIPSAQNRWQGDNRGGWYSPDYDQAFAGYVRALEKPERVAQIVQMERAFSDDVGGIPHFFSATVNAHVASLQGPIARQTPESGIGYLYVWKWEFKS